MIYNVKNLLTYCEENNIELLEDYENMNTNRECYIKGNCKTTTDTCDKTFNKTFRQLLKTGPYCHNCSVENGKKSYKQKCKYNLEYLLNFCDENNIKLTSEYTLNLINRDTLICGKCITPDCENEFNKSFRELVKLNGHCADCSKEIGKLKIVETNLKKYGVDNPMKNKNVKEKQKNTMLDKYGVERILQLDTAKERLKLHNLEKFGTEYSLQCDLVKNKCKETNKLRYGFENPQQNEEIKNKTIQTNLKKYGVENYFVCKDFKNKRIETNMVKYGVPHHSQNAEISEFIINRSYTTKIYNFPSGKGIIYQGYENFAFDELINVENISEDDIITKRTEVPEIWYTDKTNKLRRHYVDIYIKSQNRCIEVKSTWTNQEKNNVLEKKQSAMNLGYNYEIWVFNKKGIKVETL